MAFAGRFGYHPNLGVKNLDVNATVALGYYYFAAQTKYTGDWGHIGKTDPTNYSTFYYGFSVGAKYFFTKNIQKTENVIESHSFSPGCLLLKTHKNFL
jgi:hypothetical protein